MKRPAFQFYPRDYLTDEQVMLMSLEEQGAYIRLLCHQWLEGSIPADVSAQARLCGCTPRHMRKIWPVISPKFSDNSEENRLKNPRMETDRRALSERSQERSETGRRGVTKRWEKERAKLSYSSAIPVTIAEPVATDSTASATASATALPTPLPPSNGNGAHAPGNGTGKHLTLSRKSKAVVGPSRTLPEVLSGLQEFLADVDRQNILEANQAKAYQIMADIVFAYWAKILRHEGAKIDPERVKVIIKRLDAGDTVNELLFAIDGAKKDPNLMGQNERNQRFDRISTIFRNREQVERLAELGGYRDGKVHRMAEKYLGMVA